MENICLSSGSTSLGPFIHFILYSVGLKKKEKKKKKKEKKKRTNKLNPISM
jgi:hypothetical protein